MTHWSPGLLLLGIFLRDPRAAPHERAGDAAVAEAGRFIYDVSRRTLASKMAQALTEKG